MTSFQKIVKYIAMVIAISLAVGIISTVLSAVGLIRLFEKSPQQKDEPFAYLATGEITSLDVDIASAHFSVTHGDSFAVMCDSQILDVSEKNGALVIKENKRFDYSDSSIILQIPHDTCFVKADIDTGAGKISIDTLSAQNLSFDFGAGQADIGTLNALTKADINGGAGKITIANGTLKNLELDMGVGELALTSKLVGESDFDLGIGKTDITLIGTPEDYRVELDKGIGSVTHNGVAVTGASKLGNGPNEVEIDCGVGAVSVIYVEE